MAASSEVPVRAGVSGVQAHPYEGICTQRQGPAAPIALPSERVVTARAPGSGIGLWALLLHPLECPCSAPPALRCLSPKGEGALAEHLPCPVTNVCSDNPAAKSNHKRCFTLFSTVRVALEQGIPGTYWKARIKCFDSGFHGEHIHRG